MGMTHVHVITTRAGPLLEKHKGLEPTSSRESRKQTTSYEATALCSEGLPELER